MHCVGSLFRSGCLFASWLFDFAVAINIIVPFATLRFIFFRCNDGCVFTCCTIVVGGMYDACVYSFSVK